MKPETNALFASIGLFAALTVSCAQASRAEDTPTPGFSIDPLPAGPYAAGSSEFQLDSGKVSNLVHTMKHTVRQVAGGMHTKADGKITISALLPENSGAFRFTIKLPDDTNLFGYEAGKDADYAGFLLYPTGPSNARPDYLVAPDLPALPKMQRAGDTPLFADPDAKYPLLLFAHGWTADPLVHLPELRQFVAHGYVVLALFHADSRWDARNTRLQQFLPRPLSLKAALDKLEKDPVYAPHLDFERIGAVGVSAGGCTVFTLAGGMPEGNIDLAVPLIKAAVGHWPVLGGGWWGKEALWGKDFEGVANMQTPFLALNGTKDDVAPVSNADAALVHAPGVKIGVALDGERHGVSAGAQKKAMTWTLLFLDAFVKGDTNARETLAKLDSVRGKKPADSVRVRQGF
jgi:dienelactone hydrolase